MPFPNRYQVGGEVEDPELLDEEEGISPTQSLVDVLTKPSAEEQDITRRMESQAEQVRATLRAARERIAAQRFNPAEPWFSAAAALGKTTRSGTFGESMGNLSGALSQFASRRGEFDRAKEAALTDIDMQMATADDPVLKAMLELEKLRGAQRTSLLRGMAPGRTSADLALWNELTATLTPEQKDKARRVRLGLESRAGQFTVRMVEGVPTVVGVDEAGEPVETPLSNLVAELNAKSSEAGAGAIGKGIGEQYTDLQARVMPAQERMAQLDRMEGLLEGIETGRLTPLMTEVSSVLDYFGIPLDPNLDQKQAAQTISAALALQNRNPSGGAGMPGAMSDADRRFLVQMTPNLAQTPGGRSLIIETARRLARRDQEVAALARAYKLKKGTFDEFFYDELAEWAAANPLFGEGGGGDGGGGGSAPVRPENLNEGQRAELDQILRQRAATPPIARARGGKVRRRYQEGGQVVTLSDGTKVLIDAGTGGSDAATAPPTETEPSALESLRAALPALLTSVAGAAAGVGAEELGSRAVTRGATGIDKSERTVLRSMEQDVIDPTAAVDTLRRGQRQGVPLELGDVGGPHTRVLQNRALTTMDPAAAISELDRIQRRHDEGRGRVEGQINRGLKPYDYFAHLEKLTDNLYSNAKPLYEAAYAKGQGIPETPEIRQILETPEGKRAIAHAIRVMGLEGTPIGRADALGLVTKPNLQFLDLVKRGFDQQIGTEEKGGPTDYGRALRRARNRFVAAVDAAAPEEYRQARAQYAGDLEVKDALEEGRLFHQFQPPELAERAKTMSFAERNAFRTGMAQRLHELIQSPATDANTARKIAGSPLLMERLKPFFDTPAQFRLFKEALELEVDLFEATKKTISRGESGLEARAAQELDTSGKALQTMASGVRAFTSPLGVPTAWALRVMVDRPKMTETEAERIIEILKRRDPKELADFARRAGIRSNLMRYRTGRRAGAAALGAAAGYALSGNDTEE